MTENGFFAIYYALFATGLTFLCIVLSPAAIKKKDEKLIRSPHFGQFNQMQFDRLFCCTKLFL